MFGYGSPTGSTSSSYSSSYSSYSSFSSATASPMDIKPSPFSSRGPDASCAFPSWPRRSTLSDDDDCYEERVSSYLSDEDLLFTPETYEDDTCSNGSASPTHSPQLQQFPSEAALLEMQRQKLAYQREMMKVVIAEKEQRRRQAAKRRAGSASKKSKGSKVSAMTPISE
ncbi:hypothetical protein QBC42DRAFT_17158 [Cladorrhinum samala]|uniref:Uncharacterized protein n=1 Tax=Cladorrhinum samala TaxID=585594 RepID=A0AAV9HG83_9PEZI|nr:hypothetical protein QBC42DRAFT_17158 [Cladorrhinum samala]